MTRALLRIAAILIAILGLPSAGRADESDWPTLTSAPHRPVAPITLMARGSRSC